MSASRTAPPNVVLLSGVLQVLESPLAFLRSLLQRGVPFVIIDRAPFFVADLPDRLTVETVPPEIYDASYPSWFFNLPEFRRLITSCRYHVVEEFDSWESWSVEGCDVRNKCLLLERLA
jgi:putative methyltransferase (TIGR04325 family)